VLPQEADATHHQSQSLPSRPQADRLSMSTIHRLPNTVSGVMPKKNQKTKIMLVVTTQHDR
jgi:hypothetical protein